MSLYYSTKHWLKKGRWKLRRGVTTVRWGADRLSTTPAVFGNSMPKSGSHLIIQILLGLTRFGPFVNPGYPPVNRAEDNRNLSPEAVLDNIKNMRPGDIRYGYIHAKEPFVTALTGPDRATIFVYRDPRDMIVSHVFYATEIHKGHGMYPYYTQVLNSVEERINAQIMGVVEPGFELSPIRKKYDEYLCWLEQPQVLSIRFEDLINQRGDTLNAMLDEVQKTGYTIPTPREKALEILAEAIQPKKSHTFRSGKTGGWREYFTKEHKELFKDVAGDLLVRLGYEESNNW